MTDVKRLLGIRKVQKRRKPAFIRQDEHKNAKLDKRWRRPKGSDSKMRLNKRGYRKSVSVGYKSPSQVRAMTCKGLIGINVSRVDDLSLVDPKKNCVIISSGTGMKKRLQILEESINKGLEVFNYKDPQEALDAMKALIDKKRERKKKATEAKKDKEKKKEQESKKKEQEEKKNKESQKSEESEKDSSVSDDSDSENLEENTQKDKEKKENEKVLTKKS
ncbi:MAG: 50S ribosomal protein L32e [Nanobdellota archaeon]